MAPSAGLAALEVVRLDGLRGELDGADGQNHLQLAGVGHRVPGREACAIGRSVTRDGPFARRLFFGRVFGVGSSSARVSRVGAGRSPLGSELKGTPWASSPGKVMPISFTIHPTPVDGKVTIHPHAFVR